MNDSCQRVNTKWAAICVHTTSQARWRRITCSPWYPAIAAEQQLIRIWVDSSRQELGFGCAHNPCIDSSRTHLPHVHRLVNERVQGTLQVIDSRVHIVDLPHDRLAHVLELGLLQTY